MAAGGFLFVTQDDDSSGSAKVSRHARAFVMRKARSDQPWSTKSAKPVDRRKQRKDPQSTGGTRSPSSSDEPRADSLGNWSTDKSTATTGALVQRTAWRANALTKGSQDPFDSMAVTMNQRTSDLLAFC